MLITFEGAEGSGKSTQVALLSAWLTRQCIAHVVTREPGGTPLGEQLRTLLLDSHVSVTATAEAYLMTGARAQHVADVIQPALKRGDIVVSDRYVDSTLAYQGAGRGLDVDALRALQQLAVQGIWPDLTILLDVPAAIGLQRRGRNGGVNRIDREVAQFHERVAAWFRAAASDDPVRWRIIEATQPIDVVHTLVVEYVHEALAVSSESSFERFAR